MTFDDPMITYDGAPTEAFFGQLLAKVEATPAAILAAAQITPIYADSRMNNGASIIGDGSVADPWRGEGVTVP